MKILGQYINCPYCQSILIRKIAHNEIHCNNCGREYIIRIIKGKLKYIER